MRRSRWWYPFAVIVLALAIWRLFGACSGAAQTALSRRALPAGWQLIRPPGEVSVLVEDGGTIWAGGRDGLTAIDRATGVVRAAPSGAPRLRYVRDALLDSRRRLWVAHSRGLSFRSDGVWGACPEVAELLPGPLTALCEDRSGRIWVGGQAPGLAVLEGSVWRAAPTGDLPLADVSVIFADRAGVVWVGLGDPTRGGLIRLEGENRRTYTTADGLPHNAVRDITQDRAGRLHVAVGFSSRGGLATLEGGRWSALTGDRTRPHADGLPPGAIRSVFEDRAGRLWIGSEYGGMTIIAGRSRSCLTPQEGLAGWETKHMIQDSAGTLWLGTENGISRIEEPAPGVRDGAIGP